ncbi:hypothetical protein P22_0571 [Propionispora sp. 2/2-37]|uniref:glycosyltransferase family 4 protein n=1 Tax=Propionispora sp. 2/2-37 TaxID=1677858 RepID=UPI0006BB62EE|nr:glycosyltransferase family 4 protein [Propionispora sp. 2/2-37]CUH94505.1 hypothetical protein P22_0571 [Propionispora sp. 2/2-37]
MKKVLFIVFGGVNKPSTYYRVVQFLNKIHESKQDFVYEMLTTPQKPAVRHYPKILRGLVHALNLVKFYYLICYYVIRYADSVFIQKTILPQFIIRLIKFRNIPFLFDFDDAIYASFSEIKKKRKSKIQALAFMLKHANTVLAGNRVLGEYATQFRPDCEITPTVIDLDNYCALKNTQYFNYTIGWIGTSQNLVFLEMLVKPLRVLRQEFPQLKLLVICDKPFVLDDFTVNKQWRRETYIEDMLSMDIGVMPLVEDKWTRGKCSFKAIQYMALGIPVVVSPVGMNTEVVQDGISGYLASTDEEWVLRLRNLIIDRKLRQAFAIAGRKKVEDNYSLQAWIHKWYNLAIGEKKVVVWYSLISVLSQNLQ